MTALEPLARAESLGLEVMFRPRSIAVVGASASPDKAGHAMMQALRRFPGRLVPVNPRGGSVLGLEAATNLRECEGTDLAVLVVPPQAVPAALEDAAAAGVRGAVVCSGGFAESGPEGAELQERVVAAARAGGVRLLGPNTSGFMNPAAGATANFMPAVAELPAGSVGVVAQSGGVNLAISFLLAAEGVGLSLGVGLGNAVDLDFPELVDHLAQDEATTAIGLHVEGIADGPALVAAVRRAVERKPVVALKVGRSDVSDFARSHTGAMTGSFELSRAALRQAGAVVVDSLDELVAALVALRAVRLPARAEPGVGLVTGQAGPGLLVADALGARGVALPTLAAATQERISTLLPPLTFQSNPVDTGRPGPSFPEVLEAVGADEAIELVGVYALDEPGALDPVAATAPLAGRVLFASGGPAPTMTERRAALEAAGVPMFSSPGGLVAGLCAVVADARGRAVTDAEPLAPSRRLGRELDEHEAKSLLESYGVAVPRRLVAADREAARAALEGTSGPLVVKVLDARIAHKSELGGVHVGVRDLESLEVALDAIDAIPGGPRPYLLEELAEPGVELIVGATRDAVFGPTVLLGLGGVAAELGPPPVLALAPLSEERAAAMVAQLPPEVLSGFRGAPPVETGALAAVLRAVGRLVAEHEDVAEVDLNPVRVTSRGPVALDALVVTTAREEKDVQH